eukprot:TRINITY_DN82324_c0_g1_i1.p1 TRINITY_DN82324_c0_g1~~TRINITY_DN82324_c0_g1_i1.p1  ORF type:complete len:104 (-),score=1.70 TRINITY_DN82324_c0_g1_i1:25-336(-)
MCVAGCRCERQGGDGRRLRLRSRPKRNWKLPSAFCVLCLSMIAFFRTTLCPPPEAGGLPPATLASRDHRAQRPRRHKQRVPPPHSQPLLANSVGFPSGFLKAS